MSLPPCCAECVFHKSIPAPAASASYKKDRVECRRHAPPMTEEEFELAIWPTVARNGHCGFGAAISDPEGSEAVFCGQCLYWWQPDGKPIVSRYMRGKPGEWWARSGYCTRVAPSPAATERHMLWRVVHGSDSCGDGERPKEETEEGH